MFKNVPVLFASAGNLRIRNRRLPHFELADSVYFLTFRLVDALPAAAVDRYRRELDRARIDHVPLELIQRVDAHLDRGEGSAFLKDERVASLVVDTLKHFDRERYALLAWTVMPNHVHAVARLAPGSSLARVMHSWKSFTAHRANEILQRSGSFWQREYFDRIVRNECELTAVIDYTLTNRRRAGLDDRFTGVAEDLLQLT